MQDKKKERVTYEQLCVLETEYRRTANWSTAMIGQLALRLGLTHTKVYKWNWDRKRKDIAGVQHTQQEF